MNLFDAILILFNTSKDYNMINDLLLALNTLATYFFTGVFVGLCFMWCKSLYNLFKGKFKPIYWKFFSLETLFLSGSLLAFGFIKALILVPFRF